MEREFGEYYLGLDIGTNSIGWAVTDTKYNILEYRRKAMWGIHLFEEGQTAQSRRTHRCARRRLQRRQQRIALLRELFAPEISKVDIAFYQRLDDSALHAEDKKSEQSNSLFDDAGFADKEFHKKYPTIYHLRKDLMETDEKPDIRLVYLAIHHIIKYRGHFLFATSTSGDIPEIGEMLSDLEEDLQRYGMELNFSDAARIKELLTDRSMGVTDKKREMEKVLECDGDAEKELAHLLSGSSVGLGKLFGTDSKEKISFRESNCEDKMEEMEDVVDPEDFQVLRKAKELYDYGILLSLLQGCKTLSEAKIRQYEQHKTDLALLKKATLKYHPEKEKYKEMFRDDVKSNYCSYCGKSGKGKATGSCTQEDFCKFCKKFFEGTDAGQDPEFVDMFGRMDDGTFMPKQTSKENANIPYTVHRKELCMILRNVSRFYPFLNEVGKDGFTVCEKILKLQKFRIPYYVGPLNEKSSNHWAVRKSSGPILPWNFEDVVDLDGSAQAFMDNLTSMCTYVCGENVLPKNSLLYSRYMLYNELNNLTINGEKLNVSFKRKMIDDLFVGKDSKVTEETIKSWLIKNGLVDKKDAETTDIGGINNDVKASLRSGNRLREILGDKASNRSLCEDIINIITVFGEPKRIKVKLANDYPDELTADEINRLSKLKFEGWGRLSRKLLVGFRAYCPELGREATVMEILEGTQYNLMEILHNYGFQKQIDSYNADMTKDNKVSYDTVKAMNLSPAVKRAVWRAVRIVMEITEKTGHNPSKVFVETTRSEGEKRETKSRKQELQELYAKCKEDAVWISKLEGESDARLKGRSLFLYYTQLGRCMYCGKNLDVEELGNNQLVDRDHIYPRSKTKDDSVRNNLVLVCKNCNLTKKDRYPLDSGIQQKMKPVWDDLVKKQYITSEKHSRLVRRTELTEEELAKFINRQLVETSQSAKGTIEVLKKLLGGETDIVYVKAGAVSEFRQIGKHPELVKCRSVNDYHHAKDAYLNIVVGNVFDVKFTKDPAKFVRSGEKYNIVLENMLESSIRRDGIDAWVPGEDGTMSTVLRYVRRNNILFTKQTFVKQGQFFDENAVPATDSDVLAPKKNYLDVAKYGGLTRKWSCYSLIEVGGKKGTNDRILESIPVYLTCPSVDICKLKEYLFNKYQGKTIDVLIPCLKLNSCLDWGGVRLFLGSRNSENSVYLVNGVQLLLDDNLNIYCRTLEKFERDPKIYSEGLNENLNLELYDFLVKKCMAVDEDEKPKFPQGRIPRVADIGKKLYDARDKFIELGVEAQASVLNGMLLFLQCNASSKDLKIGITRKQQAIYQSNRLPKREKVKVRLVNQSITGLSENYTDLN